MGMRRRKDQDIRNIQGKEEDEPVQHRRLLLGKLMQYMADLQQHGIRRELSHAHHNHENLVIYWRDFGPDDGKNMIFLYYPNREGVHIFKHDASKHNTLEEQR